MNLRPRLALTVLAAGIPLIGAVFAARRYAEHRSALSGLERQIMRRMLSGGREECERFPETWPEIRPLRPDPRLGRGPARPGPAQLRHRPPGLAPGPVPVEFFAYRADLTSANPRAPLLSESMRAALLAGEPRAWEGSIFEREELLLALRMPWFDDPQSPCAVVLGVGHPGLAPSLAWEFLWGALAVGLLILLAVLGAAGPLVRRVRRLTGDVQRAAGDHYTTRVRVEGRDEITELAEAFNDAGQQLRNHADALEARERSLREFVEAVTHDVMLPLTVLQGHLMGLRREAGEAQLPILSGALEEAHYIGSLLRNLSTAAKLEGAGAPLQRDRLDLLPLVQRVLDRHAPLAREMQVSLDAVLPGESIFVRGDVTLIEQALSNLVHNAVRYVDRGGHVAIVLARSAGEFSLCVHDDGPGIPAEALPRLTQRRWRADAARSRYPGGSGLGLAIAGEVAARHGWKLELGRSEELGGLSASLRGPQDGTGLEG